MEKKASFIKGHNFIDAEKLNDLLKILLPKDRLSKFERNFIAYKIAEMEDGIIKKYPHA